MTTNIRDICNLYYAAEARLVVANALVEKLESDIKVLKRRVETKPTAKERVALLGAEGALFIAHGELVDAANAFAWAKAKVSDAHKELQPRIVSNGKRSTMVIIKHDGNSYTRHLHKNTGRALFGNAIVAYGDASS